MNEDKQCSKCNKWKFQKLDFYQCAGVYRSECKKCTVKRNVRYQRLHRTWKHRYVDDDARRDYMREYYDKNKEKFAAYRKEFREKYPEYYKMYFRRRKNKK